MADTATENKENVEGGGGDETNRSTKDAKSPAGSRAGSARSQKSNKSTGSQRGKIPSPVMSNKDNPSTDLRNMRRIIAEDPEWSLATVPLLWELCIKHIVSNFENNSQILNKLLPKHKMKVLEKISCELPLKVTANLVEDEGYWQRCCKARWQICDVSSFGNSWKQMYFERNLQDIIEHFVPENTDPTQLAETLPLSANYVKRLDIRQLLPPVKEAPKGFEDDMSDAGSESGDGPETDHFDFSDVLKHLPLLEEFRVTYGVRDCGMNFEWNLFQFTARDCLLLSKTVAACKTLRVFCLHRSKVDDDRVRVLIVNLLDHPGLEELDLSHNMIGDKGARAVGKFIKDRSKLKKLNLCDNQIRSAGAHAIAHALTKNTTLLNLNLRLNRLGDEGGQAIARSLLKNNTLTDINLGSNEMTEPTAIILAQVVVHNKTIKSLDLSCNKLGPDGGKQLQEGMADNTTITSMDLRLADCGQESEHNINQKLAQNQEQEREAREKEINEQNTKK